VRASRFVGVLITAALLVGAALYFRGGRDDTTSSDSASRGGQIVGSVRTEVRSYNRIVERGQTADLVYTLTQGRLVRINRSSFELEPWLAERWESSDDGRRHTLHLRPGLTWSDGTPFTSADVLFSVQAATDPSVNSVVADNTTTDAVARDVRGTFVAGSDNNFLTFVDAKTNLRAGVNGNVVSADAKLGPLQDNGGPTQTMALLAGSRQNRPQLRS